MAPSNVLTQRDTEILMMALQCLKNPNGLMVDMGKLAEKGGYKTAASANASWLVVKKKLFAGAEFNSQSSPSGTPKKTTSSKGASGKTVDDDEAVDDEVVGEGSPGATPTKKAGRKTKLGASPNTPTASEAMEGNSAQSRKRVRNSESATPAKKRVKKAETEEDEKEVVEDDAETDQLTIKAEEEGFPLGGQLDDYLQNSDNEEA